PTIDDLDLDGVTDSREDIEAALQVDIEEWKAELPLIEEWFDKIGDKLPTPLRDEFEALKQHLG
ncbi:MAG TPA: phosphoenolpyruvate carboxykinase domain-containing protein, partial [Actinokineospora sp.]|nr:phosphoenolpyruvate carboxykinase domain-containing protein [Actinokineospora sp.]